MSNNQRKIERKLEKAALYDKQLQYEQKEIERRSQLSMFEKINEIKDISDVKEILQEIAERMNIE